MARQLQNYNFNGLPVAAAYFRIGQVNINKAAKSAEIHCYVYASQQDRIDGKDPFQGLIFTITDDLFDSTFGTSIANTASGAFPTAAVNALMTTAYTALEQLEIAQAILVDSIAV